MRRILTLRRILSIALSGLLTISLGVAFEWVLLTGSSPQSVASAVAQSLPPPVVHFARPDFQTGVVFPRWGTTAYGTADSNYGIGLAEIQQQTGARWIELTIDFYQPTYTSTQVSISSQTPSIAALMAGIWQARKRGFQVFVSPEITVGQNGWAGVIHFHSELGYATWFHNYWRLLMPYMEAAGEAGAAQFALGTEYFTLEYASPALWSQLIDQAHNVFPGALTYNMNFTSLDHPMQPWMLNPNLAFIGVSEYHPLTRYSQWLDQATLTNLWNVNIRQGLDLFAAQLGKPLVLSEIGYRNSADAAYQPWYQTSNAPPDPAEQAAAYQAALSNVITDPYIAGVYFWGWSVPTFEPNWLPAAGVLHQWYTSALS